jgi:hypothetical protein
MCERFAYSTMPRSDGDRPAERPLHSSTGRILAVEIAGHLVCVVKMQRLVTVLLACLWACGDNTPPSPDAMLEGQAFQPALRAPMPRVFQHAGTVLSSVQLVTITFDDYAARTDVEAFGDAIVQSSWYTNAGLEYGVSAGAQVGALSIGPAPASITREEIKTRIEQLIADNQVPQPAAAGHQLLYLIYIPPTVTLGDTLDGIHGYHQMSTFNGARFPFAVVLDDGTGLARTTSTAAHQLINAVTNPYEPPMDGYYVDPPVTDPWSLARGEIADLCRGENPVIESGFTLPRVYSSSAARTGRFPCKPVAPSDTWVGVSASPATMPMIAKGGSVTFTLTGWSMEEVDDWKLAIQVADFSELTEADLMPELSDDMINNSTSVKLTLHAPANAGSGSTGGVYVFSLVGANAHPWPVGFIVQ